ncbi:MAG: right-handed parallel beta-helix repeat-containing protein [Chloroflexi bacterium]|nr:right-handed parallel beta-helix repeat-containing protein [Chloroflexota bacterium]
MNNRTILIAFSSFDRRILAFALIEIMLLAGLFGLLPLQATSITVNSTSMVVANDGKCTLAEALIAADSDTASGDKPGECPAGHGADTIILSKAIYTLTEAMDLRADPTGLPFVLSEITIEGNGATIVRDSNAPEFGILGAALATAKLTLNNLTIRGGRTSGDAVAAGLAAYAEAVVTLNNVTLVANITDHPGSSYRNDASVYVSDDATLIMNNSRIIGNTGEHGSGLMVIYGKAILRDSTISGHNTYGISGLSCSLEIQNSEIRDNAETGMDLNRCTIEISGSTISGNQDGGFNVVDSQLSLDYSRVISNSVNRDYGNYAGGLAIRSSSVATLTHTTVAGNADYTPDTCPGCPLVINQDAIVVRDASLTIIDSNISDDLHPGNQDMSLDFSGTTLTISNSTVSGQGPIQVYLGDAERVDIVGSTIVSDYDFVFSPAVLSNAGLSTETKTLHISNSIIQGCWSGWLISHGYNLEPGDSCRFTSTGDVQNVDFENLFGPLQDNGGPTHTRALLPGSPAIDAIPIGSNGCKAGVSRDQRGAPRAGGANQGGGACDIGAYEAESVPPAPSPTPTPTTLSPTTTPTPWPSPSATPSPSPTARPIPLYLPLIGVFATSG